MRKSLKVLALVLAAILMLSVFAGCNDKEAQGSSSVMTQSEVAGTNEDGKDSEDKNDGNKDEDKNDDGNGETESKTSSKTNGKDKITVNEKGWPITNKKITFKLMGRTSVSHGDPAKMDMFSYMAKISNVSIKYEGVIEAQINTKKQTALSSGDLPDAFCFAGTYGNFSDKDLDQYSKEGAFIDVMPYLKKYAPTIYAEFDRNPVQKALNISTDGKVYTLPAKMNRSDVVNYDHWLNINEKWLKATGHTVADCKTTDGFLEVMRDFRDLDANGNGNKDDEVPFATFAWVANFILSGWGMNLGAGNVGIDNSYKAYFPIITSGAKAACEYWYDFLNEDGLMQRNKTNQYANDYATFRSHIKKDNVGCFLWSGVQGDQFPSQLLKDFVAIPYPTANFKNSDGLNLANSNQAFNSTPVRGGVVITKKCSNVPALLRYFDYLYTDEGIMVGNYGDPSNGLYKKLSNGNYKLTDKGLKSGEPTKHAMGSQMGIPGTGALLNVKLEDAVPDYNKVFWEHRAAAIKTYKKANQENPCLRLSSFMLTSDEIVQLRKFQAAEFETSGTAGTMSYFVESKKNALDNEWLTKVNKTKSLGIDRYIAIYQKVVNRNKSNIKPLS